MRHALFGFLIFVCACGGGDGEPTPTGVLSEPSIGAGRDLALVTWLDRSEELPHVWGAFVDVNGPSPTVGTRFAIAITEQGPSVATDGTRWLVASVHDNSGVKDVRGTLLNEIGMVLADQVIPDPGAKRIVGADFGATHYTVVWTSSGEPDDLVMFGRFGVDGLPLDLGPIDLGQTKGEVDMAQIDGVTLVAWVTRGGTVPDEVIAVLVGSTGLPGPATLIGTGQEAHVQVAATDSDFGLFWTAAESPADFHTLTVGAGDLFIVGPDIDAPGDNCVWGNGSDFVLICDEGSLQINEGDFLTLIDTPQLVAPPAQIAYDGQRITGVSAPNAVVLRRFDPIGALIDVEPIEVATP